MSLWVLLILLAVIKVPLAALMLWIPFRSDEAMSARGDEAMAADAKDDGGSKTLPGAPGGSHSRDPHRRRRPRPSGPRRGPHGGSGMAASPARGRTGAGKRSTVAHAR
jgi:hypothetical protein